jgi:Uma2 family endonuclease
MHAELTVAEQEELLSWWRQLAEDADSPNRLEITKHGEVVLVPPPSPRHQNIARLVRQQLETQLGGIVLHEVPVLTVTAGVRCPDIVWLPQDWISEVENADQPLTRVPPLIVEVLSPRNRKHGIAHKIAGYLDSGAREVIAIGLDGRISFHRPDGAHSESAMGVRLELPGQLFR